MRYILILLLLIAAAAGGIYAAKFEPTASMIDDALEGVIEPADAPLPVPPLPDGAASYDAAVLASLDMQTCFDAEAKFSDNSERVWLDRAVRATPEPGTWQFPDLANYPGLVKLEQIKSSLGNSREHCGAARIAENWFMTASHCVLDYQALSAAATDLMLLTPAEDIFSEAVETVPVTGAVCHLDFGMDQWRFSNDIALLYVEDTSGLVSVPIATLEPEDSDLRRGDIDAFHIAGWGSNGDFRFLQGGVVAPERVGQSVLVTARIDAKGPDVGDSGSPLYTFIDGEPVVIGVLSNVRRQVPPELKSAAYVRVKGVRDWLETAMAVCGQDGEFVCGDAGASNGVTAAP
ncbi:MAG: trypsin-like serine protease [Pseudomonadota bacterium]